MWRSREPRGRKKLGQSAYTWADKKEPSGRRSPKKVAKSPPGDKSQTWKQWSHFTDTLSHGLGDI